MGRPEDATLEPVRLLHGRHDPLRRHLPFREALLEWPEKFHHFGVFIKKDSVAKYEEFLGSKEHNAHRVEGPRYEIAGHLHAVEIERNGHHETLHVHSPGELDKLRFEKGTKILEYELQVDAANADPNNPANDRPSFLPKPRSEKIAKIHAADVDWASAFVPRHSTYFATYFLITGLHGLHVLGGVLVFTYLWLFGKKLYLRNPEHMANRVEVSGLFWHFVDLVWIFVFPIFYLL